MPFEFDQHIAVSGSGPAGYDAHLSEGWVVGGGINGGYLLAVLGHAVRRRVPAKPDPIVVSAHYLSASGPGPATVSTRVLREGGTVATVAADLAQGGDVRLTALATFGDARRSARRRGHHRRTARHPARRRLCAGVDGAGGRTPLRAVHRAIRHALRPVDDRLGPRPAERPRRDAGVVPARRRPRPRPAVAADGRRRAATGVDGPRPRGVGAHARAHRPRPRRTRSRMAAIRHATRNVAGGMFEEDCEVWDSTDRLVAQSRQLALLPR